MISCRPIGNSARFRQRESIVLARATFPDHGNSSRLPPDEPFEWQSHEQMEEEADALRRFFELSVRGPVFVDQSPGRREVLPSS